MIKATKILGMMFIMLGITSLGFSQSTVTIQEARDAADGTEVTIKGVLTTPDYGFNNGQFFVQDETGGINIFWGGNNTDWMAGDSVEVTGNRSSFDSQAQISVSSATRINQGNPIPDPYIAGNDTLSINSGLQGQRVRIENVTLADGETWPADAQSGSGVSVDIELSDGEPFTIYIDRTESFYDGAPAPGERFSVAGVLGTDEDANDVAIPIIYPFFENEIADIVNVTFNVNTSTVSDTLDEDDVVQIRGAVNAYDRPGNVGVIFGNSITWDNNSEVLADNAGGDYWTFNFDMHIGDTLIYKLWTGFDLEGNATSNGGWEVNNAAPNTGNDYIFALPSDFAGTDTSTATIYYNRQSPFVEKADSIGVLFRVNVGAQEQLGLIKESSVDTVVGLRGGPLAPADWGATSAMDLSDQPESNNLFYNKVFYFDKDSVAKYEDLNYKFVIDPSPFDDGTLTWENNNLQSPNFNDRRVTLTTVMQDTTILWVNFNNEAPTSETIITSDLEFAVNTDILSGLGIFDDALDSVTVRGAFNGWGQTEMTFDQNTNPPSYVARSTGYASTEGSVVKYKYYVGWDPSRFDETSDNYVPGISDGAGWEEPGVTGGTDRTFTIENVDTNGPDDIEFFNGLPFEALVASSTVSGNPETVDVTFSVDMTPATSLTDDPFDPATDSLFLFVDTPVFAATQGIVIPGDEGTNFLSNQTPEQAKELWFTDDDEDMTYELTLTLQLPTLNHIGYRLAYGTPYSTGELNINGGGTDAGRRHYQYIKPDIREDGSGGLTVTFPASYEFPTLTYQKEAPLVYEEAPDYTSVSNEDASLTTPEQFTLSQNYPNPFNPTTNIPFSLPTANRVTLTVYNVLGQQVATLVNNKQFTAGQHTIGFDASRLSSGMYIYRIEAGNFVQSKSMMLIK